MTNQKIPSLRTRAQVAWDVLRGIPPYSRGSRAIQSSTKTVPFLWPSYREDKPEWQITDYASYVKQGFNLNTLIYSAIMYKVRSISLAPLRAYQGTSKKPKLLDNENDLAKLANRPNLYQSGQEFMNVNTVYLNVAGNSYVMLDRKRPGGVPQFMYPLRPDRVMIIPSGKSLKGYLYIPEGQSIFNGVPILPEDMMHIRLPNPLDPLEGMGYGLSPLAALSQSADVDNSITAYLKLFFQRGAAPNVYLKFEVPLDDDTVSRAKQRFMDMYGGYEKWIEPAVVDNGGSIEAFGQNFKEMGFADIDDRNEARILGPFGVPGILIGTRLGLNRAINANATELRRMFWEDTMLPELSWHEVEYQYHLQGPNGEFVAFDISDVPALAQNKNAAVDSFVKLVNVGIPKNTAAAYLDIEFGASIPDGDVVYIPTSLLPMGSGGASTITENPRPPSAEEMPAKKYRFEELPAKKYRFKVLTLEQKAEHWKAVDRVAQSWESHFRKAAIAAFEADYRNLSAIVSEVRAKALSQKATINWAAAIENVAEYLQMEGGDQWRAKFTPLIKGVMTEQGGRWAAELGMRFDVRNFFAEDWFNQYTLTFAQPINQTTLDTLNMMLLQAQAEGWSVPEMQKHLKTMFDQWAHGDIPPEEFQWYLDRMPPHRTEMIARTETMRSSNAGSQELFQDWGVKQHEWMSTLDDRVRDTHAAVNGQTKKITEPFIVGGEELLYPHDPSGSPGNTINCRCTVLPVID